MVSSRFGIDTALTTDTQRAVQPEMVGHYLGEFSITYKPVRHGRAGLGSTTGSRFIPLK